AAARARVVVPLARAAAMLKQTRAHLQFGYARLDDFCRERHGCSGRWLSHLAALHECFERLPALRRAVSAADGAVPLHVSPALAIGTVAVEETVDSWIELGRRVGLARLEREVRRAREETAAAAPADDGSEPMELRVPLPAALSVAFREGLEL